MSSGDLGKAYADGEIIISEGDVGDCMYVIQEGQAEVLIRSGASEIQLSILQPGDFFGEMAVFERDVRSATVRALGPTRVITVDKKNFMRRVHEDPALAFRLVETMSHRVRNLTTRIAVLESLQNRNNLAGSL